MSRLLISTFCISTLILMITPHPSYSQYSLECKATINASQIELQRGRKLIKNFHEKISKVLILF